MNDIDFVLIWVDGDDPSWIDEKKKYVPEKGAFSNPNNARFRDWGLLPYWFRSVERYAPWVRTIHFVTCGHVPPWLNLKHPQLHFVRHEDYIPPQYLPTFSSHTIELNIHRISDLAEHFVYFNDDMFLASPVKPTDFFIGGLPRDCAIRNIPMLYEIGHVNLNNINLINRAFPFQQQFLSHFWKWLNFRYGVNALRSLLFLPFIEFTGAKNLHVANAYTKTTFNQVWEMFPETLDETCKRKFRNVLDVNQWLFKYWQIVSGSFYPQWLRFGKTSTIANTHFLKTAFFRKKHKAVCLQDCDGIQDISALKQEVQQILKTVFPSKSSFEL